MFSTTTSCHRPDLLGISVHYLKEQFLEEVKAAGFSRDSAIYEIENLRGQNGVIRQKGANVDCPLTQKPGAAYVHCLQGDDCVGVATHMLSYTWGYKIGEIIDTLEDFCYTHNLNTKCTYIWICCFCINQHRVVDDRNNDVHVPTDVFHEKFQRRVLGIRRLICMMAPWQNPSYLKRVWCIFEIYTAIQNECEVFIAMPTKYRHEMINELIGTGTGINALYDVLRNTKVENAEASIEEDRITIMKMIENGVGYYGTNLAVNECIRSWVNTTIYEFVLLVEGDYKQNKKTGKRPHELQFAKLCNKVGELYYQNCVYDKALVMFHKYISIVEEQCSPLTDEYKRSIVVALGNMGEILVDRHDYIGATTVYNKVERIATTLSTSEVRHSYRRKNIHFHNTCGRVWHAKEEYKHALEHYRYALSICNEDLGAKLPETALTYNNIGLALSKCLECQYDEVANIFHKALAISKLANGRSHPFTATVHSNLADFFRARRLWCQASAEDNEAKTIREVALGRNHPLTLNSEKNIELATRMIGNSSEGLNKIATTYGLINTRNNIESEPVKSEPQEFSSLTYSSTDESVDEYDFDDELFSIDNSIGTDSAYESTHNLANEFDQYKDQNLEKMRTEVEGNLSNAEGMMSHALTKALVDDYDDTPNQTTLLWGGSGDSMEIEASVLCEVNDWLKRRQNATADERRAFMQETINKMVTSVRHGVIRPEHASKSIHECAGMLGLQLAEDIPADTLIVTGMRKTVKKSDVRAAFQEFGEIDEVAVSSNSRGFGVVRFKSPKSVSRAIEQFRNEEIVVQDVAVICCKVQESVVGVDINMNHI